MKRAMSEKLYVVLLCFALAAAIPVLAAAEAPEGDASGQAPAAESVMPEVEEAAADEALEKRKKIVAEAATAIAETEKALAALEEEKPEEALKALELATGKLELILARDPELALAPVDVAVVTYDLAAEAETIEETIDKAEEHLEDGEVQEARVLVGNLASEIVVQSTNIPLATYPDAIKAVTPLIDKGEIDEAKAGLQSALNTLVVATEAVIPLPMLRAEQLLQEAEALAENEARTDEENERLAELLDAARSELKIGELLGYGSEESFEAIYEQLDKIEEKTASGKAGEGWFDKIKRQIAGFFE